MADLDQRDAKIVISQHPCRANPLAIGAEMYKWRHLIENFFFAAKGDGMSPEPTGHVRGSDLILTRTFRAPIDDVWTSVTKSENTALWFGSWEGDAGPGKIVRLQLVHEKDQPWTNVTIEECEAPRRLVVTMKDEYGEWRIELTLTQTDDTTELRFVQHLSDRKLAGDVGPGWEYYLDMLVAAREGKALPSFEDYYPSQKAHYLEGG